VIVDPPAMSTAAFEILGTARPFGLPRVRWIAGIVGATIGCTCALVAGFVMQPAYRASIVLTVVRDNDRVDLASAIGSQLGSLASLTGIGGAASNDRAEAVSLLGSRYLARSFIERYKLLPALADAMHGPLSLTDEPPTLERAVKSLGSDVIAIDDDRRTGIIELSVTWFDREVAADWANRYVALGNEIMRRRAVSAADSRKKYLLEEIDKTGVATLREVLYRMIENQVRTAMMANTREDFAFKVVDPAVTPDLRAKVRPRRALMALAGVLLGALAGVAVVAFQDSVRSRAATP
jgi:uncharacterized protein involved in exopolysaccharide biosynthesis